MKVISVFLVTLSLFYTECNAQTPTAAAPASPAVPVAVGTVGGSVKAVVKLVGSCPVAPALKREADPFCAKTKMNDETVGCNPNGTLKNVAVRIIKSSAPLPTANPAPAEVVFDQNNCMYRPRVLGVVKGQKVLIRNSDPTMHNIHGYVGTSTLFNRAMMKGAKDFGQTFDVGVNRLKCDVHPWMTGYVVANDNPFIAVTGDSGEVTLSGLPAGTYTVEAWHEKYGAKTVDLTVAAGQTATADFSFAAQ